ncbi:MAG: SulP family inorganic anion transporter [Synergistaceae bacterium]
MITSFFKMLRNEFSGYSVALLGRDFAAGVTVAAVALPLALAFGVGCGADAAAGLITAIIAGLVMSLLSGASFQISGPTGAMTAVLALIVARYGIQGVFIVCFLAGIILLLLGLFKLGKLISLIPSPVIAGFTSGIAIIIALGQIDALFGTVSSGHTAITRLLSYFELGFHVNFASLGVGLLVMAIMIFWPKKLAQKAPSSLVAIVVATAVSEFFALDTAVVGAIPRTLFPESRLSFSAVEWISFVDFLSPAFTVATLGMIESLLCGASASQMVEGSSFDADQELVAQGVGNILIPFFGGVPATAAIARTSVAIKSGCVTRLTGVFHALGLLASMFLLSDVMSRLPLSALAGVLMMTAWRMNDWVAIKKLFNSKFKSAIVSFVATMVCTVIFDLTVAIVIGIELAIIFFVAKAVAIDVNLSKVTNDRLTSSEANVESKHNNAYVIYVTGVLFFSNVSVFKEKISLPDDVSEVIFSLRGVPVIDFVGAQTFIDEVNRLRAKDIKVFVCGAQPRVKATLERCDVYSTVPERCFFWSVDKALLDQ